MTLSIQSQELFSGISSSHIQTLILRRLQANGEPVTPRLMRRCLEKQLSLPTNSLDPHRRLVNKMIMAVMKDAGGPTHPIQKSRRHKEKRGRSSKKRKNSPYYNILRRLCFTVHINPNRLGLGNKSADEKLAIISEALMQSGFSDTQLHISNVEETLEMAEVERDRRELAEMLPVLKTKRRSRTCQDYSSFFEDPSQEDVALSSDSLNVKEGELHQSDQGSSFSCGEDSNSSEEDSNYSSLSPERSNKAASKRRPRKRARKSRQKRSAKPCSSPVGVGDEKSIKQLPGKRTRRSSVNYKEAEDSSEDLPTLGDSEPKRRRRQSTPYSDDASFQASSSPSITDE